MAVVMKSRALRRALRVAIAVLVVWGLVHWGHERPGALLSWWHV